MIIDHHKRLCDIIVEELAKIKLNDTVGYGLSGPCLVIGPQGPSIGWSLLLTLKHAVLIGEPDIGASMPIFEVMPDDATLRQATAFLLDQLRNKRFEDEKVSPPPANQEDGSPLPAGFLPAGAKAQVRQVPATPTAPNPKRRKEVEGTESETTGGLKVLDRRGRR